MADTHSNVPQELTNTIISLQETIRNVKQEIQKSQQEYVFDPSQPIGHLLDNTPSSTIIESLSLARPTSEMNTELNTLEKQLATLQQTLTSRSQWQPPSTLSPTAIPCSTAFLDLSDLTTAVSLISDVVKYSNPSSQLTPQKAFASKKWTWDPLWKEFFSHDPSSSPPTSIFLSRWYFNPQREVWEHVNMADSGLLPDEAQQRLGSWEDWRWDGGWGEWGVDVSHELEDERAAEGAKCWIFASRWQEREGVWMYVGGRGG